MVEKFVQKTKSKQIEIFEFFISQKADINAKDKKGYTIFDYAAFANNVEIVKFFYKQFKPEKVK